MELIVIPEDFIKDSIDLKECVNRYIDIMVQNQGIPSRLLIIDVLPTWAIDAGMD